LLVLLLVHPAQAKPSDVRSLDDAGLVEHGERTTRAAAKLFKKLGRLYPDHAKSRKNAKRAQSYDRWVEYRDEALRVIFDTTIYPDENHGAAGQDAVDAHVERVRAAWGPLEATVRRDLKKLLQLDEDKAQALLHEARQLRDALTELQAVQRERGLDGLEGAELAPAIEALLSHRAGDVTAAHALADSLSGYERQLLARLSDERVRAYNAAFRRGNPCGYGTQPSGAESEQVRITNDYRMMLGRPALEIDPRLIESARAHSADMTRLDFFDHTSPVDDKERPADRMALAGYDGAGGENIYLGGSAPQAAHDGWYHSSGHHRNILNPSWKAMGSGQDGKHWTQNFGYEGTLER
jgi:uncharacterized protein YkwD